MPSAYSSKELRRTAEAVSHFLAAAEAYRDDRANRDLRASVADAAGRAVGAAEMADLISAHTDPPAAGGRTTYYDAIQAWDSKIDPFTDQLIVAIDAAHQIRGTLEKMAADAELEERSLIGRIAGIVGFAGRVRKHLSDRGYSPAAQTTGFVVAVAAQVVGGLILAALFLLIGVGVS